MIGNLIFNAIAKTAFSVMGKQISKKVIIGGAAGVAAVAGGTTAGVIIHKKHKKNNDPAENEAPVEEAGAEKEDNAGAEKADVELTKNDTGESAETAPEATAKDEKADEVKQEEPKTEAAVQKEVPVQQPQNQAPVPTPQTMQQAPMNPNVNMGPNPVFGYAQQMGINLNNGIPSQFNPMYSNPLSGPMVGATQMPEVPIQQQTVEQPQIQEEVTVEEVADTVVDTDNEDKITAADIATGNVDQKVNNSKKKKNKK